MLSNRLELVVDAHAELGEGAVWDGKRLVWVDIHRGRVHQFDPAADVDEVVEVGKHVGAVAPTAAGGMVLAVRDGFALLDPETRVMTMLVEVEADMPTNRMNDGGCDPAGRFWAGTMSLVSAPDAGTLYCLDTDGSVRVGLSPTTISNGIDWSEDGSTMFFIDTPRKAIEAFDFDTATGAISRRRRAVEIEEPGSPDGMTIDAAGRFWVAMWGGGSVRRYLPDGRLDLTIEVPASQVTSCALGGDDLCDLYITTATIGLDAGARAREPLAGGLFRYRLDGDGVGRPARSFGR